MNRLNWKIPLPLFVLLIGTLLVTAASFTGISVNPALYVLKTNGTATNLTVRSGLSSLGSGANTVVIGDTAAATDEGAVAVGYNTTASGLRSAAFGRQARSTNSYSTAIGFGADSIAANQIRLGRSSETVSVPGPFEAASATITNTLAVSSYPPGHVPVTDTGGAVVTSYGLTYGSASGDTTFTIGGTNSATAYLRGYGAATLNLYITNAALNRKGWDIIVNDGKIDFRSIKDDYSASFNWLEANRDASYGVTNITLNTNVTVTGALAVESAITQARGTLTYTGSTNVLVDCSLGNDFALTVTNNVYLLFTNVPATARSWTGNVQFKQNATGGYTTTLAATNCTGTNLTFSVVANAVTLLSVVNSAYTNGQVIGTALISQ